MKKLIKQKIVLGLLAGFQISQASSLAVVAKVTQDYTNQALQELVQAGLSATYGSITACSSVKLTCLMNGMVLMHEAFKKRPIVPLGFKKLAEDEIDRSKFSFKWHIIPEEKYENVRKYWENQIMSFNMPGHYSIKKCSYPSALAATNSWFKFGLGFYTRIYFSEQLIHDFIGTRDLYGNKNCQENDSGIKRIKESLFHEMGHIVHKDHQNYGKNIGLLYMGLCLSQLICNTTDNSGIFRNVALYIVTLKLLQSPFFARLQERRAEQFCYHHLSDEHLKDLDVRPFFYNKPTTSLWQKIKYFFTETHYTQEQMFQMTKEELRFRGILAS